MADTLNLAQRDYSSTFIVSMLPKRCQPISMYVRWQIIGLRRSGFKQINIVNQFGDGQSEVQVSAYQGMWHHLHTRLSRFTVSRWLSATGISSKRPKKQVALNARHKRECVQMKHK